MKSKRNIKWVLIALTLVFSIALMAACSPSDDNTMTSDKVTETQFDEYIDASLAYFDDFSKPLQIVAERKAAGISAKLEYSRAGGVEMAKETYFGMSAVSYRKHEYGVIKEYSKDPDDNEWYFSEYEDDDDDFYFAENFGFDSLFAAISGHFDWFEYKNDVYSLKTAHFADLLEATDDEDTVLNDFKIAFKNGKVSGISAKVSDYETEGERQISGGDSEIPGGDYEISGKNAINASTSGSSVSLTTTYTFTYNNTSITIPQAALDADPSNAGIGPLSSAQFNQYLENTLDYFEDSSRPLQLEQTATFEGETQKREYSRATGGIEMMKITEDGDVGYSYRKHEGGRIKEYTIDPGDDEWSFDEYEEDYFNIGEEYGFNEMLSAVMGHYNWFEYTDDAYCLKAAYVENLIGVLTGGHADVTEFKLYFTGNKLSGLSAIVAPHDTSSIATVSYTITYNNTSITIPQTALDAEN